MHKVIIVCDECKAEYNIDTVNLKEEILPSGCHKTFFDCPVCGFEYKVSLLSKKGVIIREKLVKLNEEYKKYVNDPSIKHKRNAYIKAEKMQKQIDKLKKELRKNMLLT